MCCIIYKPKCASLPDERILDDIYRINHDGCGMCSPKGMFRTLDYKLFKRHILNENIDDPLLIHFRWATQGSVCKSNCHPFYDKKSGVYFMHNGCLSISPYKDKTDSETAFRCEMVPYLNNGIDSDIFKDVICEIIGPSRFAFMKGDSVRLFGQFIKYGECYYSNLRFINNIK